MTKAQGAEIPQMYPLKGDHELPEVSKTGIIQPVPQQPQVKPVPPVQPVQPVHEVQQEIQPNVNMNVNEMYLQIFTMLLIQHLTQYNHNLFIQHRLWSNLLFEKRGIPVEKRKIFKVLK